MDFIQDDEKMRDFFILTKDEFLSSYSYLKEEDYDQTKEIVDKSKIVEIKYIGEDCWNRPVYQSNNGILYKDISLGTSNYLKSALYTTVKNDFEGEPLVPLDKNIIVKVIRYIPIKDIRGNEDLHKIARKINFEKDGLMPETTTRKEFFDEIKTQIEWELDMIYSGVSKKILNEAYDEILRIEDKEIKKQKNEKKKVKER